MSDWRTIELSGRTLIEASAGTGKTWTISALYLRLLLQTEHRPQHILVATFSEAAAEELRERIRSAIESAIEQLAGPPMACPDPLQAFVDQQARGDPQARIRLQLAVQELDQAPIGTLHGICKRILSEHALDTGAPLNWQRLVDERELHEEICLDLWRELMAGSDWPALQRRQLLAEGLDDFRKHLWTLAGSHGEPRPPSPQALAECDLLGQIERAAQLRQLADEQDWFARQGAALQGELRALAELIEAPLEKFPPNPASRFKHLLGVGDPEADGLSTQIDPAQRTALGADPRFQFALRASAALAHAARSLRGAGLARLLPRYRQRYRQTLQRQEGFTYQWLIDQVHDALDLHPDIQPAEQPLADRLFRRWPLAMIDEFQDTDAKQYAILERIYRQRSATDDGIARRNAAPRGSLLLIGDPKQAIYGFRGGDLATYQRAAADASQTLSLDTNYRASRPMVQALNALYSAAGAGFAGAGFAYRAAINAPIQASRSNFMYWSLPKHRARSVSVKPGRWSQRRKPSSACSTTNSNRLAASRCMPGNSPCCYRPMNRLSPCARPCAVAACPAPVPDAAMCLPANGQNRCS